MQNDYRKVPVSVTSCVHRALKYGYLGDTGEMSIVASANPYSDSKQDYLLGFCLVIAFLN